MRRHWVLALAMLTVFGALAPPAFAQAPEVKINGLWDMITTMGKNFDADFTNKTDDMWYARTRLRPDITATLGKAKAVLGLEIDATWGQTGPTDSAITGQTVSTTTTTTTTTTCGVLTCTPNNIGSTSTSTSTSSVTTSAQKAGTTGAWDLNTDTIGQVEIKWGYLEFPVTGPDSLMPFLAVPTMGRLGAQPFAVNYKLGALATGDFAGVNLVTTWAPNITTHLTYVQVEEDLFGLDNTSNGATDDGTGRGDDLAVIFSLEWTPMKGLDVRPIYAYFWADGTTSGSARQSVGGGPTFVAGMEEHRHTIGFDARWTSGPWYFDPTFLYQFGTRAANTSKDQDISAFLFDFRGGWRSGPLLLEAMWAYSSGNNAKDDLKGAKGSPDDVNYFQPINTDTTWNAGWAEIWSLGVDYFIGNVFFPTGTYISYDRYGLNVFGARATYSVTPALSLQARWSSVWTAEDVDTDRAAGNHNTAPVNSGDESYLGSEVNLGFTWRFAPGLSFDMFGGYFWAGDALDACIDPASATKAGKACTAGGVKKEAKDSYLLSSRVRFVF